MPSTLDVQGPQGDGLIRLYAGAVGTHELTVPQTLALISALAQQAALALQDRRSPPCPT